MLETQVSNVMSVTTWQVCNNTEVEMTCYLFLGIQRLITGH